MTAGLLRVVWLPGSDLLRGLCHCGAAHVADGPIEVWDWLLAHPHDHQPGEADHPSPPDHKPREADHPPPPDYVSTADQAPAPPGASR